MFSVYTVYTMYTPWQVDTVYTVYTLCLHKPCLIWRAKGAGAREATIPEAKFHLYISGDWGEAGERYREPGAHL